MIFLFDRFQIYNLITLKFKLVRCFEFSTPGPSGRLNGLTYRIINEKQVQKKKKKQYFIRQSGLSKLLNNQYQFSRSETTKYELGFLILPVNCVKI